MPSKPTELTPQQLEAAAQRLGRAIEQARVQVLEPGMPTVLHNTLSEFLRENVEDPDDALFALQTVLAEMMAAMTLGGQEKFDQILAINAEMIALQAQQFREIIEDYTTNGD